MLKQISKLADMAIPVFGLGTRELIGQPCRRILNQGVFRGVRLIDTNPLFKNESMIAEVFKSFKREQIFITSKVPSGSLGYTSAIESVEKSLKGLKVEHIDLVLIESPGILDKSGKSRHHSRARAETWKALMKLKASGKAKHIGVAHFGARHIDELWDKFEVKPEANLIEFHPWAYDSEIFNYHKEKNIQIIASCPMARATRELYSDPLMIELKKKYIKSRAQICLRWGIQKGAVVIPKCANHRHLQENMKLDFEISSEDMERLDGLKSEKRFDWVSDTIK